MQLNKLHSAHKGSDGANVLHRSLAKSADAAAQVKEWPACRKWTRKYLREAYGKQPAVVANYDMAFGDYLAYCRGSCDDMPLYLFDSGFAEKAPRLADDYSVCSGCLVASGSGRTGSRAAIIS